MSFKTFTESKRKVADVISEIKRSEVFEVFRRYLQGNN